VKKLAQFGVHLRSAHGAHVLADQPEIHAGCPAGTELPGACRDDSPGSRQSVSAKIRIDPPAVRTYSTLPAEIQL
jgi:hypothetical protein